MRQAVFLALFLCTAVSPALAADAPQGDAPKMVENGTAGQYCDFPGKRLYEHGGAYFCSTYGKQWPDETHYLVLGADLAPYEAEIVKDVALAQKLSGSRMIAGGAPDLTIMLATHPWTVSEVRARAAAAGASLTDADVATIERALRSILGRETGSGSGTSSHDGRRLHSVWVYDGRERPDLAERVRDELRDRLLDHFDIALPQHEPITRFCDFLGDNLLPQLAPPVLLEGSGRSYCGAKALFGHDGTYYCAPYPIDWPRTATYAVAGPGKDAYAAEVAAAVAHIRSLTGREMTAGTTPDMLLLLVDTPLTDAQLEEAVMQAGLKPRSGFAAESVKTMGTLLTTLFKSTTPVAKANAVKPLYALDYRTSSCSQVGLRYVVRTDGRPRADVAKDIKAGFREFFDITPAKEAASDSK